MPREENNDVINFKEENLIAFLQNLCQTVKDIDSTKKNIICVMPSQASTGISDWDKVCFDAMDVLASDPYWILFQKDFSWVETESQKLVETARRYQKEAQLWVLAFCIPKGREPEIKTVVEILNRAGADSIFAWLYRGGLQTLIKSENPSLVWETVGEAFKKIHIT
jgi:hypothetical protein